MRQRGGILHIDEGFVIGRDLVGITVPGQYFLVEILNLLDEGRFEFQPGFGQRVADRSSKLGDDGPLALREDKEAVPKGDGGGADDEQYDETEYFLHLAVSLKEF